jgi:hypothetical protein
MRNRPGKHLPSPDAGELKPGVRRPQPRASRRLPDGAQGLGPWTAHYLALRLGEPDACPTTDLALRRALPPRPPRAAVGALAVTRVWVAESSSQPLASAHAARQAM